MTVISIYCVLPNWIKINPRDPERETNSALCKQKKTMESSQMLRVEPGNQTQKISKTQRDSAEATPQEHFEDAITNRATTRHSVQHPLDSQCPTTTRHLMFSLLDSQDSKSQACNSDWPRLYDLTILQVPGGGEEGIFGPFGFYYSRHISHLDAQRKILVNIRMLYPE